MQCYYISNYTFQYIHLLLYLTYNYFIYNYLGKRNTRIIQIDEYLCIQYNYHVHPPQKMHKLLATNHISQTVLPDSFWQCRVNFFLYILGKLRGIKFEQKLNKMWQVISEIRNCKGTQRSCVCCGGCTGLHHKYMQIIETFVTSNLCHYL